MCGAGRPANMADQPAKKANASSYGLSILCPVAAKPKAPEPATAAAKPESKPMPKPAQMLAASTSKATVAAKPKAPEPPPPHQPRQPDHAPPSHLLPAPATIPG